MQSKQDQVAQRSSRSDALKWPKYLVIALFVFFLVTVTAILIRGDSWSKMKARAEVKGKIDYYTEKLGPDHIQTLTCRNSLVWLLIHQKFPIEARRENNRYIADLKRIPGQNLNANNEKFLTAMEFRSAGFLNIAIEELSAIEAEEGSSYRGLNTSRWVIITLMEKKRNAEVETKCQQLLDSPEKLARLRQYNEWDPWALMAQCLAAQGKHAKAESAFYHAIALSVETHGTDDFRTNSQRVQLAHSLAAMGRNQEALTLARQALPAFEKYKYSSFESIQALREFVARLDRSEKPASF